MGGRRQTTVHRPQTTDRRSWEAGVGSNESGARSIFQIADDFLWIVLYGLSTVDSGLWTVDTIVFNMKNKPDILFENDFFVAINKPAGLLTIPDRHDETLPSLYKILQQQYQKIFIVHRLDKETSGLILFAKDEATHKYL